MKKIVLLFVTIALLAGCSVKEQETELTVFNQSLSAIYSGKVKKNVPHGEGTAILSDNGSLSGTFEHGVFVEGKAEQVPCTVSCQNEMFTGSYTGMVSEGSPAESGQFEADGLTYEGTWINGQMEGNGTLSAARFTIDTSSAVLEGSYQGDVKRFQAEGTGTFIYPDGEKEIELRGSFAGNRFDGMLIKTIRYHDSVRSYPVYYNAGVLVQDTVSVIAYLEGMRNESYCLNDAQLSFIKEHASLFDGTKTATEPFGKLDYDAFQEEDAPALIIIPNASVRSIQRYKPYDGSNTVTSMIVETSDGYFHLVFAYSLDSVENDDTVSICAMPLCRSTLTAPEQDYPCIDAAGAYITGN